MRTLVRSAEFRTTVVVMLLAVAGVVALWPRSTVPAVEQATSVGAVAPWEVDGPGSMAAPSGPEVDALRASAALDPCPTPQPGAPEPAGPLVGIVVPCLGAPGEVDLAAALAGRPALLNVWASWCAPCRAEIPVLDAYADRPDAIPVIGIDVRDDAAAALRLMADLGARYPSVVDTGGELWQALEVPLAIPTTYVVAEDGSLQRVNPPIVFADPDEVADTVRRYLSDPP
ncbi:TlpA family protein disulfide reductase [Pseudonocardia saturnea]